MRFLQIWILPEQDGGAPSYEQKTFSDAQRRARLRLVGARGGRDGAVAIHQDVDLYAGLFDKGERATFPLRPGRKAWVQVARGEVELNGETLKAGDGASRAEVDAIEIAGLRDGEVLVFDMAA